MTNGKIVSYIQRPYNIDVDIKKEENISNKFLISASINKVFDIVSHITVENSSLKKSYNLQSYIKTPYLITSDIVSNKDS